MKNNTDWTELIIPTIGVLFFVGLFSIIFYIIHEDLNTIDTRVETIDGKIYNCTEATAHDNGMTNIRKPYYIQIPTRNIKVIKKLN